LKKSFRITFILTLITMISFYTIYAMAQDMKFKVMIDAKSVLAPEQRANLNKMMKGH